MPYKWVEPELYLEHKGVKVYHTYKSGNENDMMSYIFTTDMSCDDSEDDSEFQFDVRDLANELQKKVWLGHPPGSDKEVVTAAIEYEMIKEPEEIVLGRMAEQLEDSELLLELVHDVASRGASNVNNGGPLEQLRFLVENVGLADTKKLVGDILDRSKGVK
jgi:hypothetical protein